MPRPEVTKIINIDGKPLLVEQMSEQVKQLVEVLDELRTKQYDANLVKIQADTAVAFVQNQLAAVIQQEQAAAAETAANDAAPADGGE